MHRSFTHRTLQRSISKKVQRFQYCVFSFCVVGQASATNQPCRGRGLQRDTVEVTTLPCLSPLPLHHSLPTGQGGTVLIEPCVTLHTVAQWLSTAVLSVATKKGFHLRVACPQRFGRVRHDPRPSEGGTQPMCSLQAAWPAALSTSTLNHVQQWIREELRVVGPTVPSQTDEGGGGKETAKALATAQMVITGHG
jgi:hypothetical protein